MLADRPTVGGVMGLAASGREARHERRCESLRGLQPGPVAEQTSKRKRMRRLMRPYVLTEPGRLALRRTIRRTRPWRWTRGPSTPAGKRRSSANSLRHGRRRASVIQRIGNQAAVLDALHAHIDFDETTLQQPRTAFKALRRIARAAEQAVRHGDPDEFGRPTLDCLQPLADMPPEACPTRAEIDAILYRPDAAGLSSRATWQLVVGLSRQAGSNIDAAGVVLRIDEINRRSASPIGRNT